MAISIQWKITRLEIINKDGLQNVAIQSCFDVEGVDENDKRGFVQGDVMLLPPSDPAKFIDVDNITEAEAIAWTKKALPNNGADFEARVAEQIGWQYEEKPKAADLSWITSEATTEEAA